MTASILMVCHGNICRSPMAMAVLRQHAEAAGVEVEVDSAGVSAEESGHPIDPRAARTLAEAGYPVPHDHRARRVVPADVERHDLLIGMVPSHVDRLQQLVGETDTEVRLLSDFIPDAAPGTSVADPWYGSDAGFVTVLEQLEAAMPALVSRCREL